MYKRGNSWYTDFVHDGNRYTKSWGPLAKSVAKEKEINFKSDVISGKHQEKAKRILFENLSKKYIKYAETNKKHHSARRNKSSIEMLMPFFKGKLVGEINSYTLEQYKNSRKKEGRAPATINRDLDCAKNMMKKAVDWEYIKTNPFKTVKKLKEDNERMFVLTDAQEDEFLAECDSRYQKRKYLKDLVTFAFYTGMRLQEILNLRKSDVNLKNHYLSVRDKVAKNHENRKVPLNDTATAVIQRQLKDNPSDYVFCTATGQQITVLTNAFWNAVKDAGLIKIDVNKKERFRFHDCRHTFGSRLGMKGYDLKTIMEIMGIKSPKVAMRYMHPAPEHKLNVVKSLDKVPSDFTTPQVNKIKN